MLSLQRGGLLMIDEKQLELEDEKNEYQNGFKPREVVLKPDYPFYNHNIFFVFVSKIVLLLTVIGCTFAKYLLWGFRITGKKNIKGIKGAITISNHCLIQDAFINVPTFFPKKVYVTMLQSNLGFGFASRYLRFCGAVPIPTDQKLMIRFLRDTKKELTKNQFIHIYPEAHLIPYCDHIRKFMPGAFHIAYAAKVPIIPICITFHKPKGFYFWKKKPMVKQNILKPYYPDYSLPKKECITKMCEDLQKTVTDYFNAHSDYVREVGNE